MTSPLPPQSGSRTIDRPNPIAANVPRPRRARPAVATRATAIREVRIRFIAKPIMRLSACPMLRIDRGRTASVARRRAAEPPRQDQHRRRHRREQGRVGVPRDAEVVADAPEQAGHDQPGDHRPMLVVLRPGPAQADRLGPGHHRDHPEFVARWGCSASTAGRSGTGRPRGPRQVPQAMIRPIASRARSRRVEPGRSAGVSSMTIPSPPNSAIVSSARR